MTFTQVGLWTVIAATCGLVLSPLWGRLADRIGHWQVLLLSSSVAALVLPPLWLLGGRGGSRPSGRQPPSMRWPGAVSARPSPT